MTKEEQLKIFSAYLPYGLQLEICEEVEIKPTMFFDSLDSIMPGIVTLRGITNETSFMPYALLYTRQDDEGDGYIQPEHVKPILYDLSYLTKEIEYEGQRFVPIVELLKIKYPNQQGRYAETEFLTEGYPFACFSVDAGKTIRINTTNLENQPFWIIHKLIEWHFNVFNLDESEYINKATLKTK